MKVSVLLFLFISFQVMGSDDVVKSSILCDALIKIDSALFTKKFGHSGRVAIQSIKKNQNLLNGTFIEEAGIKLGKDSRSTTLDFSKFHGDSDLIVWSVRSKPTSKQVINFAGDKNYKQHEKLDLVVVLEATSFDKYRQLDSPGFLGGEGAIYKFNLEDEANFSGEMVLTQLATLSNCTAR